ncbi:hypothetical protein [Lapillicoccus sp.]|uniref:hypothetical protein n=1 Tax=Lapillicoccus sp. TaxID=1909287 RepID=UPI003982F4E0
MLALFGMPAELKDPDLFAAVDEIEKQVLPDDNPAVVYPWSVHDMALEHGPIDVARSDMPCVRDDGCRGLRGSTGHRLGAYLMLSPQARADALH